MRELYAAKATFRTKVAADKEGDPEAAKFRDYFAWEELVATAPSHRILAMRRGEEAGFLILRATPPEEEAVALLDQLFVKAANAAGEQVRLAVRDGYKRLLCPSMEGEIRLETKKRADEEAIRVFARNLSALLLAAPAAFGRPDFVQDVRGGLEQLVHLFVQGGETVRVRRIGCMRAAAARGHPRPHWPLA